MLFIENKNRKQKRNKRKKSSSFLPLFARLLLKVEEAAGSEVLF